MALNRKMVRDGRKAKPPKLGQPGANMFGQPMIKPPQVSNFQPAMPMVRRQKGGKVDPKVSTFSFDDPKFDPKVFERHPDDDVVRYDQYGNPSVSPNAQGILNKTRDRYLLERNDEDRQSPPGRKRAPEVRFKRGGKIKGYLLGGLTGGSSGSQTQTSNTSQSYRQHQRVDQPSYQDLMGTVLNQAGSLATADPSQFLAGFTDDQNQAFGDIRANQGNYQPFFNQAQGSLNQSGNLINQAGGANYDPTQAGTPLVDQAAGMQTGSGAADPYIQQATGSWTDPGTADAWMSPYQDQVANRIADLGNRNLMENVLPKVNDTFTGGAAGQFGRERHADITGRAIRDNQESILGAQGQLLNTGYQNAQNAYNTEQNRVLGAGQLSGSLANQDRTTTGQLGATRGTLAQAGQQGLLNQAGAQGTLGGQQVGLGQATQQAAGTDANALLTSGGIQQQQNQREAQGPLSMLQLAQGLGQGWQLPTESTGSSQSQTTATTSGSPASGSPVGQILGAGMSLGSLAIPGASGTSALGNIFGGGATAPGTGMIAKRGGQIDRAPRSNFDFADDDDSAENSAHRRRHSRRFARGGALAHYAHGGFVPSVRNMRMRMGATQQPMQGALPQGMPQRPTFARGGSVPGYAGGGALQDILGTIGGVLGNLIPIPGVGSMIGRVAGRGLGDAVDGGDFSGGFADGGEVDDLIDGDTLAKLIKDLVR